MSDAYDDLSLRYPPSCRACWSTTSRRRSRRGTSKLRSRWSCAGVYTRASAKGEAETAHSTPLPGGGYEDDENDPVGADASQPRRSFPAASSGSFSATEGSTVSQMVKDALRSVPNPSRDTHVDELNRIRESLRARRGTQPVWPEAAAPGAHQAMRAPRRRARPACVRQRTGSRGSSRRPQRQGARRSVAPARRRRVMTGPALAALIERSVTALNEGDFPSAGNVVDSFNRDALERHMASYASAMDGVRLPVDEEALTSTHRLAAAKAMEGFRRDRFGRGAVTTAALRRKLGEMRQRRRKTFLVEEECETSLDVQEELVGLQTMRLPSLRKFDTSSRRAKTGGASVGGSQRETYGARTSGAWRGNASFSKTVAPQRFADASIGGIVTFEVSVHKALGELVACLFISLEVGPKLTSWGRMFNPVVDRGCSVWEVACTISSPTWTSLARADVRRARRAGTSVRRCVQWLNGCCPCIVRNCCCTSLLGIPNARPKGKRKTDVSGRTRDLDV